MDAMPCDNEAASPALSRTKFMSHIITLRRKFAPHAEFRLNEFALVRLYLSLKLLIGIIFGENRQSHVLFQHQDRSVGSCGNEFMAHRGPSAFLFAKMADIFTNGLAGRIRRYSVEYSSMLCSNVLHLLM